MKVYVVTATWNGDIGTQIIGAYTSNFKAQAVVNDQEDDDEIDQSEYCFELHEIEVTE